MCPASNGYSTCVRVESVCMRSSEKEGREEGKGNEREGELRLTCGAVSRSSVKTRRAKEGEKD